MPCKTKKWNKDTFCVIYLVFTQQLSHVPKFPQEEMTESLIFNLKDLKNKWNLDTMSYSNNINTIYTDGVPPWLVRLIYLFF
jgi:hypothetical protein